MDAAGIRTWIRNRESPEIGLATYQLESGKPVLTDGNVTVQVEPDDIKKDQLRLTVPLAVTNLEAEDLGLARVEPRYPSDLKVKSAGSGKIDPTGRTIVYDHDLGTLRPTGDFTPVAPLDEVVIPFGFTVVPTVTVSKDNVPFYIVAVAGSPEYPYKRRVITMAATIYFADRPSVTANMRWSVSPGVEILSQGSDDFTEYPLTQREVDRFGVPSGDPIQNWAVRVGASGPKVRYRKYDLGGEGLVQAIEVEGVLRRVIIDSDRDGYVDVDMIDDTGDGRPDAAGTYPGGRLFVDWDDASR